MPNHHRGEIEAEIGDARRRLVLTLGALAERFGSGRLKARDLVRIIAAGLRGAGEDVTDDAVAEMTVADGAAGYVRIAAKLIAATFGGEAASEEKPARPLARSQGAA